MQGEKPSPSPAATPLPPGEVSPQALGVSEAQSAVVNDSPVDCQSRRPGLPAGKLSAKLTERANGSF